jgi:hypothetical protein
MNTNHYRPGGMPAARSMQLCARVALLATMAWSAAFAANTVITFDDVAVDTPLGSQYHSKGVDFGYPAYYPATSQLPGTAYLCCIPITRAAPSGHSSQVANMSWSSTEVFGPGMFGTFTSFHSTVQVTVGDSNPGETTTVTLTGYDINMVQVAQSAVQTVIGGSQTATLSATVGGSKPTIAYFYVQPSTNNTQVWADDLTFDNPSTAATPDFTLGPPSGGNYFYVSQGASASETIPIDRFNGSSGNITFSASGLPYGVTATFSPNPVPGVGLSTTLTLTAANNVQPFTNGTFTVTADPKGNSAVAPQARTAKLPIEIQAALVITGGGGGTSYKMQPCTPLGLGPIEVYKYSPIIGDVSLALRTIGADGNPGPLPSFVQATFNPPVATASTLVYLTISISAGSLTSSQQLNLVVQGTSGSYVALGPPFAIQGIGDGNGVITSITPSGRTPQAMQPGTQVVIKGQGFCTSQVEFGNINAGVAADSSSATEIRATVPRLATTGPIKLSYQNLSSTSNFEVDSYRNAAGFAFKNYKPDITYGQFTEAFGENQTYDTLDLCPPFGCDVSWPEPVAWMVYHTTSSNLGGQNGGACFGFSLASQRLLLGQRSLSDFPPSGAQNNFGLAAASGASGPITDYINSQAIEQVGTQFMVQWLGDYLQQGGENAHDALAQIHASIQSAFANGETPLISLHGDGSVGHVVVAYDLEDNGPDAFTIYVYDSNLPFQPNEDQDILGATHKTNVSLSAIQVLSDGTWNLPSSGMSGAKSGLMVVRASSIPVVPTLASTSQLFQGPFILFGDSNTRTTQLADASGHTLFGANGKLNTDSSTTLKAAPLPAFTGAAQGAETFLVSPTAGALVQTISGTAAGPEDRSFVAPGFVARFDTQAVAGISDRISFDPAGTASFQTNSASKPLTTTVAKEVNGVFESAELATTSFQGGTDELRFDSTGSTLTLKHSGASTTFQLRLMSRGKNAPAGTSATVPQPVGAVFTSGTLSVGAGATIIFSPADWTHLKTVAMTVRDPQGSEITKTLDNQSQTTALGRMVSVSALQRSKNPNLRQLTAVTEIEQVPADAEATLTWPVKDATGKVVGHKIQTLTATDLTPGEHSYSSTFLAPDAGDYTVHASLAILSGSGIVQDGQANSASSTFSVVSLP